MENEVASAQAPVAPTCILVIPANAVGVAKGGGQRSAILFSALQRLGPTRVVVLGDCRPEDIEASFPGHAGVIRTGTRLHELTGSASKLQVLRVRLQRFALIERHYRPDPEARAQIASLLGDGPCILAFRYFRPFCLSGIDRHHPSAPLVAVDIDDRDDQRLASIAAQMFQSPFLRRLFDLLVLGRLRRLMRRRMSGAHIGWFVTEEDTAGFDSVAHAVLRNVPFTDPGSAALPPPSAAQDLLFVGTAGYRPNVDGVRWFLRSCWPEIHRRHPQARFRVVGLSNWAGQLREFAGLPGLDVVGFVEELAPEYARARAVVAPVLEGGGSKIKVIEACAFARPVVTVRHSARGFGPEIGAALAVADSGQEMVEACNRFLAEATLADRTGATLHALQQAHFSRKAAEAQIADDIGRVLNSVSTEKTI